MYSAFHKLFGSYKMKLHVSDAARLLNLLNREKVLYWGAAPDGEDFYVKASLFSCEKLVRIAKEAGISIVLHRASGLPFVFDKYRGRIGLTIGSFAGLFIILFSQLFLWEIEVTGIKNLTEESVVSLLAENGIEVGGFLPRMKVSDIKYNILSEHDELVQISVNIKGTYAQVDLIERTHPPEIIDTTKDNVIIASRDGIIKRVETYGGNLHVRPGDAVIEGQLLADSYLPSLHENVYHFSSALGSIYAEVYEDFTVEIPLIIETKTYTGKKETSSSSELFGNSIDVFVREPSFELYDTQISFSRAHLFGILKLPIFTEKTIYSEYTVENMQITEPDARARAEQALAIHISAVDGEVVDYTFDGEMDKSGEKYTLTARITKIIDIAIIKEREMYGVFR